MNLKMSITWDLESAQGDVQRKSQMQIKKIGVWSFKITCVCARRYLHVQQMVIQKNNCDSDQQLLQVIYTKGS